ncbi:MAG: transcriptional repressor [Chloroflexi bacterium]|nr:transcriptional repressor [Chloroflexota bacterium]
MTELDSIVQNLESRGHRVTPARRAVVGAVLGRPGHFTVDDVLREEPGAGRATVFRTMRLLCDLGILCRVILEDGSLHYRLSQRGHHHHLVCVSCGSVRDMDDCVVDDLVRELSRQTEYDIEGHWLEFYGRCRRCRPSGEGQRQ